MAADRREYYRQRYLRNRERILEKQKAYGKQPEIRARRLKYWHERYKARIARDPELKAKRRRQQLDSYYLRHYGTTTPEPGARSAIDGRRYLGPKELRPPKPCAPPKPTPTRTPNTEASSSVQTAPQKPSPQARATHSPKPSSSPTGTSQSPSTTRSTATTAARPSSPPTPPWVPQPVSRWEPGLARQAEREFYL